MPLPLYKEAEMRLEKETAIYQLGAIAADIDGATTLAKGKNKIFYQDTAPASGMNAGDLWFKIDSSGGSSLYEYKKTGSNPDTYAWTLRQLGQGSLLANSVTANEINVNNLAAISANIGTVTAGVLRSSDYSYSSGTYTTAGMIIDLNNKIYRTPNTAILADGSFYTKSGTIGPWTIGATGIYNGLQGLTDTHNGIYIGTDGIGIYDSSKENRLSIKNDASIVLDGAMSSSGTITPASNLPRIIFKSAGGALGDCALVYRDFNNLSEINGLHLVATIGDATFVSDKIVSNIAYIHHSVQVNGANNVHTVIRPNLIQFKPDADVGIIQVFYNSNGYNIIRNHNNGDISVSASSGTLYLGYENTTSVNFFNGKVVINSNSLALFTANMYCRRSDANAWIQTENATGGNAISIEAHTDGTVLLWSRAANGTAYPILQRANNSSAITTYGNWAASGSWLFNDAFYLAKNGDQYIHCRLLTSGSTYTNQILCGHTGNNLFFGYGGYANNVGATYFDGNEVHIRTKTTITFEGGAVTFNGGVTDYVLTSGGMPITCVTSNGNRLGQFSASSSTAISVYMQNGTSGSGYTRSTITVSSSDKRMKKNIEDCNVLALPIINTIRMRQFDWISNDEHQNIGFIADELESIDSKLSIGGGYDEENRMIVKSVDTFYLLGYAIKAIQELSAEVKKLKGVA